MKKTVTGLLLSMMILLGISSAGNITVENKSSTSSCNSSETVNKYLYLSPGEYTVSDKPWDTFKNTVDSLIKKGSTSVQIRRNGVIADCNDWNTSSIVVSSADANGASIIVNRDGCDFDKPGYTKTGNPTAIDAQIHYTIGYARVWEEGSKTYNGKLYHKDYTDTNWTCYPGGNKVTDNQECPNVTVKYVDETKYHVGECINYRVFRCGDGLVNRPGSVTYDNGYHYESCDPESPDWKNRADGKTCSAKCEIVEPVIKEDPVCNSTYNNQTKYTDTSAVWLSSSDNLCSKGEVKNFKYSGEPRTFTWNCEKDGTTTGCTAKQQRCGDGERNGSEECDPNDASETNWGNDGCSLSCKKKIEVVSACDEEHTYYRKLRHLSGYIFEDNFLAGSADRRLYGTPDVKFEEKMDYNRGANPTFNWTSRLINNDMKVSAGEKRLVVESTPEYVIKDHPAVREKDNLYIEYTLKYANKKYSTTPDESRLKTHKECVYYEISRCGDGVLDTEHGEECDPGSEGTKVLPDGRICNSDCKIGDAPTKGKAEIEKTLKDKVPVEKVGQTLKWTVKVTAKGGDVTDFEVQDLLPEALDYVNYKVVSNSDNLQISGPKGPVKSGSNNIYTWDVKGTLKDGHVLTLEIETKVNKMPNSDDDYRNIACVIDDGDKDCDDDEPEPTEGKAEIEKTLKDKVPVEKVGQTLKWTVKVTAKGGDVTDFEVQDLLPEALDYVNYKVVSNSDNLQISGPKGPVKSGSNNIYTWDVKGTLKDGHVLTLEIETKVNKMPNSDDDYRNIACVIDDGDKDCDDDEPEPTEGKAEIEKTLKDKVPVEKVGQTLKWTVKVTAKGGDVTDFEVQDLLPEALDYVNYKVVSNSDNLQISGPKGPVKSGSNNIYTWDVKGTLKDGHVLTLEIETKVNKMPNSDDDYRNIACVIDDGDKDCDDDKPDPTGGIKIEKTLKNKIIVTRTGEILTWTVRVTAKSGDVTNFEVKDLVPPVLKYKGYKVTSNQDNLTVKDPTGPVIEGANNVYTWEVKGTLKKDHVLEMEIETEVIKMPKAGDDNRNVACVIYESTKDCDPEDIPYLWIRKTFSDGSKEVKTVKIGEKIAYKIAFGNSGQINATITSIKDFLPKNVEYESSTISINGYNHDEIEIGNGMIEKSQEKREGVQIDTFTGITLKPGDTGYIILTGVVKSEFTGDRTNFACIYLNDKQIDCDDVKHDISTDVSCKPTLNPSSFGDVSCSDTSSFSTTVTCSSTGGKADLEIICNGTVIKTGHDEKITGTCTGTANNTDYKVQCKINGSFTGVNGESCDGSFRRGCYNPGSSCFVAGTKVLMANGSEKNIEDVDIGDKLLGSDGSINTVKGFDRPKLGERNLRSINGSKYFVSDEHPFKTTDGWKAFDPVMARKEIMNALAEGWLVKDEQTEDLLNITELKLGDILLKKNGLGETVVSLSSVTSDPNTQLYNFVLDGDNTYYADGYLVHNKGGGGGGGSTSPRCDSLEPENGKIVCRSDKNAYLTMYCDGIKVEQLKDEKDKILKYSDYSDCKKIECYVSDTKLNGRNGDKCERKNEQEEGTQLCINVNAGNFSLEEGEIFPFYWNLRNMSNVYKKANNYTVMNGDYRNAGSNYDNGGECSESQEGKIAKDSMICEFNIYDGKEYHKGMRNGIPLNSPLYTIEGPCLSKTSVIDTNKLIKARYNEMKDIYCNNPSDCDFYDSAELPTAVYYIQKFGSGATVHLNVGSREGDWSMTRKDESKKSYGEYKIELSEIKYLVCENGSWQKRKASEDSDFVGCQGDLMLTNSYTVQKTPSGNLTASTKELKKYLYYDGSSTFDKLLNAIESTDYKPNAKVEEAMDKFIDKYKKLAVKVNLKGDSFLEGTNVSKVPGKDIYFVDGSIKIKGGTQNIKKAFTIVQTAGNTTIDGNVNHNMMLLTKGNIIFQGNCKEDQEVKGIFYAGGNLSRNGVAKNTDTTVGRWCRKGGLHVKGVLIGNNFKNLMLESRSNINDWFIVRGSDQEKLNQRRRYVMNGASVVIEYSPSIFTKSTMPPGAEDFTTALSIYKN